MPRSSYYTNAGNPLQRELLPGRHLDLEFLYAGSNAVQCRQLRKDTLIEIALLDLGVFIPLTMVGMIAFGYIVMMFVAYALICAARICANGESFAIVRLAGKALLSSVMLFVLPSSPQFGLLVLSALLGRFTFQLGQHWCYRCTTSPMPRSEASLIRQQWSGHLMVVAFIPLIAAVASIVFSRLWLFPAIIVAFGVVQLLRSQDLKTVGNAAIQALTSWCSYNNDKVNSPGIFQSPSGTALNRRTLLVGTAIIFAWCCWAIAFQASAPTNSIRMAPFLFFPGLAFTTMPLILLAPLLQEALLCRRRIDATSHWNEIRQELNESTNPVIRDAYFMGTVASDGSPLLLGRSVFDEHAHFLGSTGAGKTSRGICPWLERTIGFGDCSLIVIDLKADTHELLSTMRTAADQLKSNTGKELPLKVFSSQNHLPTHGFNPLQYSYWHEFDLYQRTDILCSALGLIYGVDYGQAYYSSTNAAVLFETMRLFPDCRTFKELADRCHYVISNPKRTTILPGAAKNADHLHAQLMRLGDLEQLQVKSGGRYSSAVIDDAIDLTDMFRKPQLLYVHLSAALAAGSAPTIARLFAYILLTSATQTNRQCRVYLVIDEFQRMCKRRREIVALGGRKVQRPA